jgi:hypothetical protein
MYYTSFREYNRSKLECWAESISSTEVWLLWWLAMANETAHYGAVLGSIAKAL